MFHPFGLAGPAYGRIDGSASAAACQRATIEMPQPKAVLNMRVDQDVLDCFREPGRGYQTRINAVLKSYVSRMRHDQH